MRALPLLVCLAACRGSTEGVPGDRTAPPVAPAPAGGPDAAAPPGRALTEGEIALIRPLFAASLDYAQVRVVHGRFFAGQPDDVYMTPDGNLYAPAELYLADYTAGDPYQQGVFVHEMVHAWQHQGGVDVLGEALSAFANAGGDYQATYAYRLERGRDLLDYNHEQQATIVEEYFRLRVHGEPPVEMLDAPPDPGARDALFAAVLRRFLAEPGYLRARER